MHTNARKLVTDWGEAPKGRCRLLLWPLHGLLSRFTKLQSTFKSQELHTENLNMPFLKSLTLPVRLPTEVAGTYPSPFLNPLQAPRTAEFPKSIHKEVATEKHQKMKA